MKDYHQITLLRKPTTHKSKCPICQEQMQKGEWVVHFMMNSFHADCFYCYLKKRAMAFKFKEPNCEDCKKRFACFTEDYETSK